VAPVLAPSDTADRRAEAVRLRDRRLRGIGLLIMLVNVVVLALAVWIALDLRTRGVEARHGVVPIVLLALSLASFTLTGALYLAFDLTLGRAVPFRRGSAGAVILVMACCPWLIWPILIIFSYI
jgi:hypothetical protein